MTGSRYSLSAALRTPVAIGYLALVMAVAAWVAVDTLIVTHADASFAGVWLFFVTAPTSIAFTFLPGPLVWLGVPVGAVVQAALLGAAYRGLTGQRRLGTS